MGTTGKTNAEPALNVNFCITFVLHYHVKSDLRGIGVLLKNFFFFKKKLIPELAQLVQCYTAAEFWPMGTGTYA